MNNFDFTFSSWDVKELLSQASERLWSEKSYRKNKLILHEEFLVKFLKEPMPATNTVEYQKWTRHRSQGYDYLVDFSWQREYKVALERNHVYGVTYLVDSEALLYLYRRRIIKRAHQSILLINEAKQMQKAFGDNRIINDLISIAQADLNLISLRAKMNPDLLPPDKDKFEKIVMDNIFFLENKKEEE